MYIMNTAKAPLMREKYALGNMQNMQKTSVFSFYLGISISFSVLT